MLVIGTEPIPARASHGPRPPHNDNVYADTAIQANEWRAAVSARLRLTFATIARSGPVKAQGVLVSMPPRIRIGIPHCIPETDNFATRHLRHRCKYAPHGSNFRSASSQRCVNVTSSCVWVS